MKQFRCVSCGKDSDLPCCPAPYGLRPTGLESTMYIHICLECVKKVNPLTSKDGGEVEERDIG